MWHFTFIYLFFLFVCRAGHWLHEYVCALRARLLFMFVHAHNFLRRTLTLRIPIDQTIAKIINRLKKSLTINSKIIANKWIETFGWCFQFDRLATHTWLICLLIEFRLNFFIWCVYGLEWRGRIDMQFNQCIHKYMYVFLRFL